MISDAIKHIRICYIKFDKDFWCKWLIGVSANRTFMLLSVPKEYGQYRLKITVLGDWPQLQKEGLEYFIKINTQPNK